MKRTSALIAIVTAVTWLFVVYRSVPVNAAQDQSAICSFTVPTVPQKALDDLCCRIAATLWREKEAVADKSEGMQLGTMLLTKPKCQTSKA